MPRTINTTEVVGATLVALLAGAFTLLATPAGNSLDRQTRIVVAGCAVFLGIATATIGCIIERRRRAAEKHRLQKAHAVVDRALALLDQPAHAGDQGTDPTLDWLVERLNRLVGATHHLVDERRQREREVMRSDQLAMVGQLAAGVAHELRNPLTSIKMLVQSGQKEGAPALAADDLAIIEHEIRRLERSLQRFLDFARPPHPERRPLNVAQVVRRALALVEGRAKKQRVRLNFTPPPDAVTVEADEDQIQQLLLNLLLNSLDVMTEGGSLTIELQSLPEGQVELRVRDTGPGIPTELLPRLFDPFMSTKEAGIGLGLAVSHRIAERHGATLLAHNEPGGGACFVLRLAQAAPTAALG